MLQNDPTVNLVIVGEEFEQGSVGRFPALCGVDGHPSVFIA